MRKTLTYLFLSLLSLFAMAQQQAANILDRATEALRRAGGIRAEFTVKADNGYLSSGTISLKGEKFVLEAGDTKTWFDGHTQWTYLSSTEEVNISEPTSEELQSINPYVWLALYKQGYTSSLQSSDKQSYKILLTATNRKELQSVTIYIRKNTYLPLRICMMQQGGENTDIQITSCQTHQSYSDTFFKFDKRNYPDAEIIDLR